MGADQGSFMTSLASRWGRLRGTLRRTELRLNASVAAGAAGRFFKLESRNSTFTRELRAGLSTFLTMAYILSVNSAVLSDSGGPCKKNSGDISSYDHCVSEVRRDFVVATALTASFGSAAMGLLANLPFAIAPAMGTNAYFTYTMVGFHGGSGELPYGAALAAVMLEGVFFFIISAIGLRSRIARLIPRNIRRACAAGIGFFLAFAGLQARQGVGLIGPSKSNLVTLTACTNVDPVTGECDGGILRSPTFWLGAAGFFIAAAGISRRFRGSIIFAILFVTILSWPRNTPLTIFPSTTAGDEMFDYFKRVVDFRIIIRRTAGQLDFSYINKSQFWVALSTLLYVDLLDTTGSMYSMAELGGFTTANGRFDGEYKAFMVDAAATVISTTLGTTTATTFIESTVGINEGGRTGITALVVSLCFAISTVLTPLMTSVPPWAAGPAMVLVGVMMAKIVKEIEWEDMREAAPAFLTMVLMPLTFSIANGIVAGLTAYVALNAYDYIVKAVKWVVEARRVMAEARNQVSAAAAAGGGVDSADCGVDGVAAAV